MTLSGNMTPIRATAFSLTPRATKKSASSGNSVAYKWSFSWDKHDSEQVAQNNGLHIFIFNEAYPTQIYANMLANQSQIQSRFNYIPPTYEQLKQSIASININYNVLGFTLFKEYQKITTIDLVTSIGGNIGLFLGLSFHNFFEVIELFVELLFLFVDKYIFRMH